MLPVLKVDDGQSAMPENGEIGNMGSFPVWSPVENAGLHLIDDVPLSFTEVFRGA